MARKQIYPLVWLGLVLITVFNVELVTPIFSTGVAFALVMILAGIKALLIIWHFIGIGQASRPWKLAFGALITAPIMVIIALNAVIAMQS